MRNIILLCISILIIVSCKEDENTSKVINEKSFNESQADTLLSIYITELSETYNIKEVIMYNIIEIENNKFFYAKVKVVGINEINESIEEIIIKFFDTNIPITKYIITNLNEGFKFTTGSDGDCTDCQFKSDETNLQSILVECKDDKDKSSDCNLEFQENVNLWDLNKYNQGVILLKGIVNANFTPLQNTWPF